MRPLDLTLQPINYIYVYVCIYIHTYTYTYIYIIYITCHYVVTWQLTKMRWNMKLYVYYRTFIILEVLISKQMIMVYDNDYSNPNNKSNDHKS